MCWVAIVLILSFTTKSEKRRKWYRYSTAIIFFVFTNRFISTEFLRILEVENVKIAKEKKYDVGIILGGLLRYDASNDRIIFSANSDRFLQAYNLYKEGKIDKLLISGGSGDIHYPDNKESEVLREYLIEIGVKKKDIIIETKSRNTYENAMYTVDILDSLYGKNNSNYLLFTSSSHIKRSIACFEKQNLKMDYFGTNKIVGPRNFDLFRYLVPSYNALYHWDIILHEWIGWISYKFTGKI